MKKILALSLAIVVFSVAASAQGGPESRFRKARLQRGFTSGQINRPERRELGKDAFHYKMLQNNARRDGVITPFERRRLHRARCESRRDLFRFKHNGRRRLI